MSTQHSDYYVNIDLLGGGHRGAGRGRRRGGGGGGGGGGGRVSLAALASLAAFAAAVAFLAAAVAFLAAAAFILFRCILLRNMFFQNAGHSSVVHGQWVRDCSSICII